jgi:hypothetical protein
MIAVGAPDGRYPGAVRLSDVVDIEELLSAPGSSPA